MACQTPGQYGEKDTSLQLSSQQRAEGALGPPAAPLGFETRTEPWPEFSQSRSHPPAVDETSALT